MKKPIILLILIVITFTSGDLKANDRAAAGLLDKKFQDSFITHRVYNPKQKTYYYYNANEIYKTESKKSR